MEMDWLLGIACCTAALVIAGPFILSLCAWSVVKYSPYPYCFSLVSSGLWIVYAARHNLTPLYYLNWAGALANALYTAIFIRYSARADHRWRYLVGFLVGGAVIFAIIALVDVAGGHDGYDVLCSIVSVLVSLAPFGNLLAAPSGRWREAMPAFLIPFFALLNAVPWTVRNTLGVRPDDLNLHLLGPPPPPTGVRRPLISQSEREEADGSGHGGELRLNVDLTTNNGEITIIKDDDIKIATSHEVNNNTPPHGDGGELRLDLGNGDITITKDNDINIATGQEVDNNAPPHGGELRQHVHPTTDNSEITIIEGSNINVATNEEVHNSAPPRDQIILARTGKEMTKLPEEELAGQIVLGNTPAVTSTKDKVES